MRPFTHEPEQAPIATATSSRVVVHALAFGSQWLAQAETVAAFARAWGAGVRLVHVRDDRSGDAAGALDVVADWYSENGLRVCVDLRFGPVDDTLVQIVEETAPALMVLGAADRRARSPGWVGSHTLHVVRTVRCPLVVLPWAVRRPRTSGRWRILHPTDFGPLAGPGAAAVATLADTLDAELYLAHVSQTQHEAARRCLEQLSVPGERVVDRALIVGDRPPHDLIAHASLIDADLIAIPSHGRGPIGALLLGSVTETILRFADRPVLILKPDKGPVTK